MSGGERLKICAGAAHNRLVVIVARGVGIGELSEIGRIAHRHVIEAHCDGALIGAGGRIIAVLRPFAGALRHPDEEIPPAAVDLLPHLEEAVYRVAYRRGVIDKFGDLKRAVRQLSRKTPVGNIARLTHRVSRPRPGQFAICADNARGDLVIPVHLGAVLRCQCEIRPRIAVTIDDPLRQQIVHLASRSGLICAEQIVEAEVLSDDDDQVLDRCGRRGSGGARSAQGQQHQRRSRYSPHRHGRSGV